MSASQTHHWIVLLTGVAMAASAAVNQTDILLIVVVCIRTPECVCTIDIMKAGIHSGHAFAKHCTTLSRLQ